MKVKIEINTDNAAFHDEQGKPYEIKNVGSLFLGRKKVKMKVRIDANTCSSAFTKTAAAVKNDKPYKLTFTRTNGSMIPLGHYRTEMEAATALSVDYNVPCQDIVAAWRVGSLYEIKGAGGFTLSKENNNESED